MGDHQRPTWGREQWQIISEPWELCFRVFLLDGHVPVPYHTIHTPFISGYLITLWCLLRSQSLHQCQSKVVHPLYFEQMCWHLTPASVHVDILVHQCLYSESSSWNFHTCWAQAKVWTDARCGLGAACSLVSCLYTLKCPTIRYSPPQVFRLIWLRRICLCSRLRVIPSGQSSTNRRSARLKPPPYSPHQDFTYRSSDLW